MSHRTTSCQICGKTQRQTDLVMAAIVRPQVTRLMRKAHPDWSDAGFICVEDLNAFRHQYIQSLIEAEKGEITSLERSVVESLRNHEILAHNVEDTIETSLSLGDRLSDRIASFGGSWRFIGLFGTILLVWIIFNSVSLLRAPFDPYPFILLNLVLSCLAAIQAPVIMMSQNRQEAKDRLRSEHDYQVNLKAELEIRHLHQKMDHLLSHQWQRLLEIQQIQVELMNDLRRQGPGETA